MKDIPISELRKMSSKDIRESGCFRVVSDGSFICLVITTSSAEKRIQIEALASQINAALGK